ncbi:MAG TPA: PepSY domain-containing protein [Terracidiphilus sp.]|jgi:uncharacterized iron-regulated membrane protein
MASSAISTDKGSRGLDHRTVWRWHFYAGLLCIPFVLWLSVTGTIYLFKPQIEAFLDRPYDHLTITQAASLNAQVQAAVHAVPGSVLDQYQLPRNANASAQILVDRGTQQFRVYVHPQTLQVLKIDNEDRRLEKMVFHLHGELLMGKWGSGIIELAGSWAVVMIVSGIFLWWPRDAKGLGGVLYPRLRAGGRTFWKDIHSVTGMWISVLVLFQLFTGLPWAKSWSAYLSAARHLSGEGSVKQDWLVSSSAEQAARAARSSAMSGMDMGNMPGMGHAEHDSHRSHSSALIDYAPIDKIAATVAPLNLAYPVLIAPPIRFGGNWTAKSDAQDRPLRVDLVLDPKTGVILQRKDFSSKPWLDRVIGTGIAAHEGQLFGPLNQILSLVMVAGLVTLSISGLVMWWHRRPEGVLGAPVTLRRVPFSAGLLAFIVAFGVYMPFLGGSMLIVFLTEKFLLRRLKPVSEWLGLQPVS